MKHFSDRAGATSSSPRWLGRVAVLFLIFVLCSCWMTVAPKHQESKVVSYVGGSQDAGLKSYDQTGFIVAADWVKQYHQMLAANGSKLPPSMRVSPDDMTGIEDRGDGRYHVLYQVNSRYARLKYIEQSGP